VGWDSLRGEFQFVADEAGPALLVTLDQLDDAELQRDGSYVLWAYTDPDYQSSEQFTAQPAVVQLARSMVPSSARAAAAQTPPLEASLSASSFTPQAPRPPLPASASESPVSFVTPRFDPIGKKPEVVPLNWDAVPPPAPELITDVRSPSGGGVTGGFERWIVRYAMTNPSAPDEQTQQLEVDADSDSGALRALHAELQQSGEEITYRVLSVVPAGQTDVAL
jgi:hypothetical protein